MKKNKKIFAAVLALILALAQTISAADGAEADLTPAPAQNAAEISEKNETIYARLSQNGDVSGVYAVNHFNVARAGKITDYGAYDTVLNLTDLEPVVLDGETSAVWLFAGAGDYYYQGNLSAKKLPWTYAISYTLDGKQVSPEDLAGAAGEIEISFKSSRTEPGWSENYMNTFYDNYMQQITFTLDTQKCAGASANGGVTAMAGKNRVFVFTILPGHEADIKITVRGAADFEMPGIDIAASSFSMDFEIPELNGLTDDFSLLSNGISELNDGMGDFTTGIGEISTGFFELSGGGAQLSSASSQILAGINAISSGVSASLGANADMSGFEQLPQMFTQLSDGLLQISSAMKDLKTGYEKAYAALDAAISQTPGAALSQEQIAGLYALVGADSAAQGALKTLVDNYTAAQTVKGTYGQTKTAFAAIPGALDAFYASIAAMNASLTEAGAQIGAGLASLGSSDINAQISELSNALKTLAENYAAFHKGLLAFTDGAARFDEGFKQITDGAGALYDGTNELASETKNLPERVKSEINNLISDFGDTDFTPVSFTSDRNEKISVVQFVFKTEPIEKKQPKDARPAETKKASLWDKLIDLF